MSNSTRHPREDAWRHHPRKFRRNIRPFASLLACHGRPRRRRTEPSNVLIQRATRDGEHGCRLRLDVRLSGHSDGGIEKLQDALRPGGMENRKAKMLTQLLEDVKTRNGVWDLDFLLDYSHEEATKEVLQYHGIGSKSAFCLLSVYLQRKVEFRYWHAHPPHHGAMVLEARAARRRIGRKRTC